MAFNAIAQIDSRVQRELCSAAIPFLDLRAQLHKFRFEALIHLLRRKPAKGRQAARHAQAHRIRAP